MEIEQWNELRVGDCIANYDGQANVVVKKTNVNDRVEYLVLPGEDLPDLFDADDPCVRLAVSPAQWLFVSRPVLDMQVVVGSEKDDETVFVGMQGRRMVIDTRGQVPIVMGDDTLSVSLMSHTRDEKHPEAHALLKSILGRKISITVKLLD